MKKLMIVLILAFLYCSEHESQNRDDADKELEELRKKDFMLNGNEIEYNDYIYYIKYLPEEEPPQVRNYDQEIQKFLP